MKLKYIFGPVVSRRLGLSLGIDLIPFKTCSLDCIYCECGATNRLTLERKEYVPTKEVIEELDNYLSTSPNIDFITFSGSGEPTLHSGIGIIIDFLKDNYSQYKVALLTNSTLFNSPKLIEEISRVDLIVPSLDAVLEKSFSLINRPISAITSSEMINNLVNLRKNYSGQIWLEIFIVPGINDSPKELNLFRDSIDKIRPDKVQLNSLDRPGTEKWIDVPTRKIMEEIADYLGDNIEIIKKAKVFLDK